MLYQVKNPRLGAVVVHVLYTHCFQYRSKYIEWRLHLTQNLHAIISILCCRYSDARYSQTQLPINFIIAHFNSCLAVHLPSPSSKKISPSRCERTHSIRMVPVTANYPRSQTSTRTLQSKPHFIFSRPQAVQKSYSRDHTRAIVFHYELLEKLPQRHRSIHC